jgi:hypothetical protein
VSESLIEASRAHAKVPPRRLRRMIFGGRTRAGAEQAALNVGGGACGKGHDDSHGPLREA